ncbi:MAG: hypothetical protein HDS13_05455 [Bacteroides sp.]|nr:hypothetical protein [Bacteroides sp.]
MPEPMCGVVGKSLVKVKRMITFYTKATGSSHIASNKPCQDNGVCYQKDGVHIAIVCDGHGGESYVRSDVGSQLAADIALEKIIQFINNLPSDTFNGKKGANTVIPTSDPRIGKDGKKRELSELSEGELELLRQNLQYVKAKQSFPEIENHFRKLFNSITDAWRNKIIQHLDDNPFSRKEKECIGSRRIEKAYGSTLIAAVRTPNYWFAFQIGDGKLYVCDRLMYWYEPVPWDCNCFLNVTTSLCDYSPVEEFRYAFDGTGYFPLAFALGSDGIEDTFIQTELIHKFYSNLLKVFNEREFEEAKSLLTTSLSDLSKRGSHDDMSVAAIIDTDYLSKALEYYAIISEVRSLTKEKKERQESIDLIQKKILKTEDHLEQQKIARDEEAESIWNWWKKVIKLRAEKKFHYESLSKEVSNIETEIEQYKVKLQNLKNQLCEWISISKIRVDNLRQQANELEIEIYPQSSKSDILDRTEDTRSSHLSASMDVNNADNPNEVYEKASQAKLSEEKIAEMENESEAQAKEILNKDNKNN